LQGYELHDTCKPWDTATLDKFGLEYVGEGFIDYECSDKQFVGIIETDNHERDSSNEWVRIYKRK
jgi:hypothetical protein